MESVGGGGPTGSKVLEEVDDRETPGTWGLGTGRGRMMRPPGPPDILDSSRGGPSVYSVSFVSDPLEVS